VKTVSITLLFLAASIGDSAQDAPVPRPQTGEIICVLPKSYLTGKKMDLPVSSRVLPSFPSEVLPPARDQRRSKANKASRA